MKSRFIRMALISGLVLSSPLLTFAGGQPAKVRTPTKDEMQDRTGITRAVQQGKGTGMSRSDTALNANAYRVQTGADDRVLKQAPPSTPHPSYSDSAFTK